MKTVIITRTFEIKPNQQMKMVIDRNIDYRRNCWNQALEIWNDMYQARDLMLEKSKRLLIAEYYQLQHSLNNKKLKETTRQKKQVRLQQILDQLTANDWELAKINPSPTWQRVRDQMVADKTYGEQHLSSRILQLAVQDLGKAFNNYFNQDNWGKPKFISHRQFRQGFKTDTARIKGQKLYLDQPRLNKENWSPISLNQPVLSAKHGVISIYRERGKYYVSIPFKVPTDQLRMIAKTNHKGAVDLNVDRFVSTDKVLHVTPQRLTRLYQRVKHYQRQLAKKRNINGRIKGKYSRNYQKIRRKLQLTYLKIHNIQHDLMHKFTTSLLYQYDQIVIEDLNVNGMKMSHVASKGLHRSMFGLFRRLLTYKCQYYNKTLILADRFYPSTQRCSYCGHIKKHDERITLAGNRKHHTNHNQYVCYNPQCPEYLQEHDRDLNAAYSLLHLATCPEDNHAFK